VNSSSWGSVERDIDALGDCCFDLGKNRRLFCKWVASLEGCNVMNSSCKDFFFWLLDGSMKCWAEVLWINMMGVLGVCFFPIPGSWGVKDSSLVCDPLVVFPEESYPEVFVANFDEFNSCMVSFGEIDVVSGVFMSGSVIFKVYLDFYVLWEVVLLSPMNSSVLVEFSNECYCHQDVTGVVLCFKDVQEKPDLC